MIKKLIITFDADVTNADFTSGDPFLGFKYFSGALQTVDAYWWPAGSAQIGTTTSAIEIQTATGTAGEATAIEYKDHIENNYNSSGALTVTQSSNIVTIETLSVGHYISEDDYSATFQRPVADEDISITAVLDATSCPTGSNKIEIVFTTDAVDGDSTKIGIDVGGPVNPIFYDWVTTSTDSDEISIPTPTATPGEASAIIFALLINSDHNSDGTLNVYQVGNTVTIEIVGECLAFQESISDLSVGNTTFTYSTIDLTFLVRASILGQDISGIASYCYLYEPLLLSVTSSSGNIGKAYVDLELIRTDTGDTEVITTSYAEFETIPNKTLRVDLMEIARQYHSANVFKMGRTTDIISNWESVVSKYKYKFTIRSGEATEPSYTVYKLPIIGGRDFQDFTPIVLQTTPIDERSKYNIDLTNKYIGLPVITTTLADPTATDSRPTISVVNQASGCKIEKSVVWKSHLGGWMSWGFKLENKTYKHKYEGRMDVEIFESTQDVGGHIYKPVDYTGVETNFRTTLKSLSLSSDELNAVSKINFTPAAYYVTSDGKMELMRIGSVSAPLDSKANGGDFSVGLSSIGSVNQSTM